MNNVYRGWITCQRNILCRKWHQLVLTSQKYSFSTQTKPGDEGEEEITKPVLTATLDPEVDKLFNEGLPFYEHPGKRKLITVNLPSYLELAAKRAISRHLTQKFREDAFKMNRRMYHLDLPEETEDLIQRKRDITEKVIANEPPVELSTLNDDEIQFIKRKREKKINSLLNVTRPSWKEITYNEYDSHVYLGSRLGANYSTIKYVMNEIRLANPLFKPKTLFDFGSGHGTTMFAVNDVWPNSVSEHFNVDISPSMNELATFLLRGGKESNPMIYNGVYFREYLPLSSQVKYDLVVSAFTLMELPSRAARVHAIESLWQKTHDMLVIIESGTKSSFSVINEVRSLILDMTGHDVTNTYYEDTDETGVKEYDWKDAPTSHIVAPCPHHMTCPRMFTGGPLLCCFHVNYHPLDIGQQRKEIQEERFCYIVLRKGTSDMKKPLWPRINQTVIKNSGHIICRACCPDGGQKSITLTKAKHKGNMYNCAKSSKWGDLLPANVIETEKGLSFWEKVKRQRKMERQENREDDDD